ncbi:hypothetical protein R1sor_002469 [Riccia sorocarpa]|uniref:Uncharacterized protein n=1 Tax=Riccia sorocarpa TaxID=122646 RepID=A0ABD3H1I9_9MARC
MEIDLHNEPGLVSWVVDYFKRGRNLQEIVLRIKGAEVEEKETKAKDLGVVCFTRPNEAGLEIWFEVLKNKQIKRTILPMATWEHDDLLPKGKGGVLDFSDDSGTNDKYSDVISTLRFYLLAEKKSQSSMWEFLELCHKYSVDLIGSCWDFRSSSGEGSKKLKAPVKKLNVVTPKKPTIVEAPKKATTGSAEAPEKSTTGSAEAPKKSTTGSAEAPRKSTTGSAEGPRKSTGTVEAPKLKIGPTREYSNPKKGTFGVTPEASKLISRTSTDTTGQKTKSVKFIGLTKPQTTLPSIQVGSSSGRTSSTANAPGPDNTTTSREQSVAEYNDDFGDEDTSSKTKKRKIAVLEKKSGFQPDRHVVKTDQVADDVKMQLDPKTKDQLKSEFEELRKWFPLGDKLVYASISHLTDPYATVLYRPCSIRHVAEIQNSMIGSADTPQAAIVVPYELEANGKKKFLNILTMKDLKAFIKKGRKFMVISGLHSMKAAKNIILSVGGDKDHDLYGRAIQSFMAGNNIVVSAHPRAL